MSEVSIGMRVQVSDNPALDLGVVQSIIVRVGTPADALALSAALADAAAHMLKLDEEYPDRKYGVPDFGTKGQPS